MPVLIYGSYSRIADQPESKAGESVAQGEWEGVKAGRVQFTEDSFFNKNPTEGADIYFLRHVL